MKSTLLIIATWAVTTSIAVFGASAAATIWFYVEPVMESVPDPASYAVSVYSGLLALALSAAVSVAISIHLVRCRRGARTLRSPQSELSEAPGV